MITLQKLTLFFLLLLAFLISCSSSDTTEPDTSIEEKRSISGDLSYGLTDNKYEGFTNAAVSRSLSNTITGTHDLSIAPSLTGTGLSFEPSSGTISGTPRSAFSNRYTVTATGRGNYAGTISALLIIAVFDGHTPFTIIEKDGNPVELTISNNNSNKRLFGATNWSSSDNGVATVTGGVVRFAATSSPTNVIITATIGEYSTNKEVSVDSATVNDLGVMTTKGSHKNLIISDSTTTLIGSAFFNQGLTSVRIGNSVGDIGSGAFQRNQLISVTVSGSVTNIRSGAFRENQLTSVIIPNSVKAIGQSAFLDNQLRNLIIGDSVEIMGERAFEENLLTSVVIPDSIRIIHNRVFLDNQLTNVKIGNAVTNIGVSAFQKNKLTSVTIPNSVVTIGTTAFWRNQLTNIIIPDSMTDIGRQAFADNQLTRVTIPSSVKTIGDRAFENNPLTDVTLLVTLYNSLGNSNRTRIFGTQVQNWYKLDGTKQ